MLTTIHPALLVIALMFALSIPAFVVRFAILKRPIGKGISIALCAVYGILVLVIRVQIGIKYQWRGDLPDMGTTFIAGAVVIGYFTLTAKRGIDLFLPLWARKSESPKSESELRERSQ